MEWLVSNGMELLAYEEVCNCINIMFNMKRLARLIVGGNPGKIFFPDAGKNSLQRTVTFSNRLLTDIVEIVKNTPKELSRNLICITPKVILKFRQIS